MCQYIAQYVNQVVNGVVSSVSAWYICRRVIG